MGLCESKPWQISLRDVFEKIRCYSACCGGQVIIEEQDETDSEEDKVSDERESINRSQEDF